MKETLEEAAKKYTESTPDNDPIRIKSFIEGAKWHQEKLLEFINDEENHTEGELGNSCIDVQSLIYFIGKEVGHDVQVEKMYSELDLLNAFEAGMMFVGEDKGSFKEWFEQNKKK
jgi:hypothetical protein